ncbi:hypothetical protein [Natronolimnobius baerhuensis]|uniref:Uncharacterized protein n=1 Tax=Natronolimnobius baerhuensis TaxID=253108 RepID=A0A202EAR4_9EURY|nr:hypothetical protein [Natronolimnobius baerhuensis]OVE85345.1 hypothetical protein B2G88_00510 [Natronolimnobius baerhuensis]
MDRSRLALAALAVFAWCVTLASHLITRVTTTESERIEWTERRNLFLLVSSLATNTLVFTTICRVLQRRLRR